MKENFLHIFFFSFMTSEWKKNIWRKFSHIKENFLHIFFFHSWVVNEKKIYEGNFLSYDIFSFIYFFFVIHEFWIKKNMWRKLYHTIRNFLHIFFFHSWPVNEKKICEGNYIICYAKFPSHIFFFVKEKKYMKDISFTYFFLR